MNLPALLRVEIVRYGMISAVAFAVDLGLLTALTSLAGIHYLLAAAFSFIVGGVIAYFLSIRFVFRFRRIHVRSAEATIFVALGIAGLAVNTVVMALMVGRVGASILVGKVAAACTTFGVNYLLRKLVLFSPKLAATDSPGSIGR